jgi:hypothetical protein
MDAEILRDVKLTVRSGMYDPGSVVDMFLEDYEDEVDEGELAKVVEQEYEKLAAQQASWPEVTDVDRLEDAFDELNENNFIALMDAGYTQSDGYDDVCEIYAEAEDPDAVEGYCFFHHQDLLRAVESGKLYLAFGPMDAEREKELGPSIGKEIVATLHKHGLKSEWDGSFDQRILVSLDWKRRPDPEDEEADDEA